MGSLGESGEADGISRPGIKKIPTKIRGFDEILQGGLPQGALTLLSGGPGTGKTMLGLEFLVRGALDGHPGIFLTFDRSLRDNPAFKL